MMGVYCDTVALHSSLALCYLPALSSISILFNSLTPRRHTLLCILARMYSYVISGCKCKPVEDI